MNKVTDIATYAFLVAGIMVMTRPKSKGPAFVRSLGAAFTGIVQASTGQKVTVLGK